MGKAGEPQGLGRVWRGPTPREAGWRTKYVIVVIPDKSTTQHTVHQCSLRARVGAVGEFTGDKDVTAPVLLLQAVHLFPTTKAGRSRAFGTPGPGARPPQCAGRFKCHFLALSFPCHTPSDFFLCFFLMHSLPVLSINLKPFGADIFQIACLHWQRPQLDSPEPKLIILGLSFSASSTVFFFKSLSISEHESGDLHIAFLQKCSCF